MLIDSEVAAVDLVTVALKVLVEVAMDANRAAGLDQRLMVSVVNADAPSRVLPELDAGGALRVHRPQGPPPGRLGGRLPFAADLGRLAVELDDDAQIVELVRLVVVWRAVRVEAFDVDDVGMRRIGIDRVAVPHHRFDDAGSWVSAKRKRGGP